MAATIPVSVNVNMVLSAQAADGSAVSETMSVETIQALMGVAVARRGISDITPESQLLREAVDYLHPLDDVLVVDELREAAARILRLIEMHS